MLIRSSKGNAIFSRLFLESTTVFVIAVVNEALAAKFLAPLFLETREVRHSSRLRRPRNRAEEGENEVQGRESPSTGKELKLRRVPAIHLLPGAELTQHYALLADPRS